MTKLMSIQAAFNGGLAAFYRHCIRYGTVTQYRDYLDESGAECRDVSVIIQGHFAVITKRRGEVVAAQYYSYD